MPQVNSNFTIQSQRRRYDILIATMADMDGEQGVVFSLPAGYGDLLVFEAFITVINIATLIAAEEDAGVFLYVVDTNSVARDQIGSARFSRLATATALGAQIRPDSAVYVRDGERIALNCPELDTNAAPAADGTIYLRTQKQPNIANARFETGIRLVQEERRGPVVADNRFRSHR